MMKFKFSPCKEISLFGDDGQLKAIVTIDPPSRFGAFPDAVGGSKQCADLINFLRNTPKEWGVVFLHVLKTGMINPINRTEMNILDMLDDEKKEKEIVTDLPQRFVCPATNDALPQDGVLEFVTVAKLADLLQNEPANTVYMFDEQSAPILKCLVDNFELFGFAPVLLTGVPGIAYSPAFENQTWALQRAAYHATVNDIIEFKRKADLAANEQRDSTIYGREQARITRKSGETKRFTAFDAPQEAGEIDPIETADSPSV